MCDVLGKPRGLRLDLGQGVATPVDTCVEFFFAGAGRRGGARWRHHDESGDLQRMSPDRPSDTRGLCEPAETAAVEHQGGAGTQGYRMQLQEHDVVVASLEFFVDAAIELGNSLLESDGAIL